MVRCSVIGCENDSDDGTQGIYFFSFPKSHQYCIPWIRATGRTEWRPRNDSKVCSEHFEPSCFEVNENGMKRLKLGAAPTKFLNPEPLPVAMPPAPEQQPPNPEDYVEAQEDIQQPTGQPVNESPPELRPRGPVRSVMICSPRDVNYFTQQLGYQVIIPEPETHAQRIRRMLRPGEVVPLSRPLEFRFNGFRL